MADLDELSIPIRTFHMLCERLSAIEEQNREIKDALVQAEYRKLGNLDARLLGFGNIHLRQYYVDRWDAHLFNHPPEKRHYDSVWKLEGNVPYFLDLKALDCMIGIHTEEVAPLSFYDRMIYDELGVVMNDDPACYSQPVVKFDISAASRPYILGEAMRRRASAAVFEANQKSKPFHFEHLETNGKWHFFHVSSKDRYPLDLATGIRLTYPALDALGAPKQSISHIQVVHHCGLDSYLYVLQHITNNTMTAIGKDMGVDRQHLRLGLETYAKMRNVNSYLSLYSKEISELRSSFP